MLLGFENTLGFLQTCLKNVQNQAYPSSWLLHGYLMLYKIKKVNTIQRKNKESSIYTTEQSQKLVWCKQY